MIEIADFNGRAINDGVVFRALLEEDAFKRTAAPVVVEAPGAWPRPIRSNPQPLEFTVAVAILSGDLADGMATLSRWFSPRTEGWLTIDDDGVDKEMRCTVVGRAYTGSVFRARLSAPDPRWRSATPIAAGGIITASGQQFTVNNTGDAWLDDPVVTLRPLSHKGQAYGQRYAVDVVVANRSDWPLNGEPVEITAGGWNHAAIVAAGRSLANGNDVRVLFDGLEVPHWWGTHTDNDPGSAQARIWAVGNWNPKRSATLLTAMTSATPGPGGDIEVVEGGTAGWSPSGGVMVIDGECIAYNGVTKANKNGREAFTGIVRGRRGTAASTHAVDAVAYWVEHRVEIVYGDMTAAAAPPSRLDVKPMIDLSTNTVSNLRHEWVQLADSRYPSRAAQWSRAVSTRYPNYGAILEEVEGPSTALTAMYRDEGAIAGAPNFPVWRRQFPTGLKVSATDAYRSVDSGTFTTATSVTRTKPTGVEEDDPLYTAIAFAADPGTITLPTGWAEVASVTNTVRLKVYLRTGAASEPANYQWTWVNAVSGAAITVATKDAASAVRVLGSGNTATTAALPGTVTPTLAPSWLVAISAKATNGAFTPATGWTERAEASANVGLAVSDRYLASGRNERVQIGGHSAPSSAGAYVFLQIPMRGPIRYVKSIADTLALAHYAVDGDGNQILTGYELPTGLTPAAVEFAYTGAEQTWIVPTGVTEITVDARGASGGGGAVSNATGGAGSRVQAKLSVTPGETLRVYVGGAGGTATGGPAGAAGYNGGAAGGAATNSLTGGGGGGGATDLRQGGSGTGNRKIVAAGGGGGGGAGFSGYGGNGGAGGDTAAGSAGANALVPGTLGGYGGQGGTSSAGGAGGTGNPSTNDGSAGASASGGAGAAGGASGNNYGGGGGGGGGGYYGGGGGEGGSSEATEDGDVYYGGGGGGGGSSYFGSGTSVTSFLGATQSGNGALSIQYVSPGSDGVNSWVPPVSVPVYEHDFETLSPVVARPPVAGLALVTTHEITATNTDTAFQFTAGEELMYLAALRLKLESATGGRLIAKLYTDNGSDAIGDLVATSETESLIASTVEFDAFLSWSPTPPLAAGQKHWITLENPDAASTDAYLQYVQLAGHRSKFGATTYTNRAIRFALMVTPDHVEALDAYARSDDGHTNSYSAIVAHLNAATVPYVAMTDSRASVYRVDGQLVNETTGDRITVRALARLGDDLQIDCGYRNLAINDGRDDESFLGGVEFATNGKMTLAPGRNVFSWIEAGVTNFGVLVEGRAKWE